MTVFQKGIKLFSILNLSLISAILFSACSTLDVVGQTATKSFETLTTLTSVESHTINDIPYWKINTPDGQGLYLASNSKTTADAILEIKASPFINAGLKVEQLKGWTYEPNQDLLLWHSDISNDAYAVDAEKSVIITFNAIMKANREAIGYHKALDHYGIKLGEGNLFEWAKDDKTNDKDLVLVLNPEPFLAAGVDPARLTNWVFAKVEVMDEKGNSTQVDKFLSPYELSQ